MTKTAAIAAAVATASTLAKTTRTTMIRRNNKRAK